MRTIQSIIALGLAILGCAACSSSTSSSTEQFIGTWQYVTGTETDTCNGVTGTPVSLTGTLQFEPGTQSGTIEYVGTGGCTFTLDVNGNVATAAPGASCVQTSNGATANETITSYTATLSGSTISVVSAVTATVTDNGAAETCTSQRTATLNQVAK